ncbi:hypothetical protein [Luteitalea sp.]|uniref:hypothetical protein n=1 Tax=Luteitalea sp. TaxID=2004800 RepID=UPI0025BE874F|nr:hypothetical protein [Luteitalea sp.]
MIYALFRVAAGPRLGHGHLRRAEVLARSLRRPSLVSVRGGGAPTCLRRAPAGAPGTVLDRVRPAVLVLDDPHATSGRAWLAAARRRGVPVVSLHDLGRGRLATTLAIDGSVTSPAAGWPAARTLRGLPFAVIRPPRRARVARVVTTVLISLGGGPRASWARAVAAELIRRRPKLMVFATGSADAGADRVAPPTMVAAPDGLAPWLARVDVAIVGGGVSLYEAVAAGVPTVAVPVVPAQRPTIRGFAARRLTVDAGGPSASLRALARRIGDRFERIADDAAGRRHVRQAGPRAVDGRGARRVAREIAAVVEAARRG